MPFLDYLHRVVAGETLSHTAARQAMLHILAGEATTAQIAGFLVALRMRGEAAEEILGFALAMREQATPVHLECNSPLIDTCGTGGDGGGTFNVSTIAAFVVAGAGVRVAKHGNRSLSSQCGSADLLEELGVPVPMPVDQAARAITEVGFGFLFAPLIHPAMKYAQPARAELKLRTAFNLLGPLTNPAGAQYQLIGAPSVAAATLMAQALTGLPVRRAFVVHGSDGMDEITTTGATSLWEVNAGQVHHRTITPADFGVPVADAAALRGGDKAANAAIARAVLSGEQGPRLDIVLVNAAAALVVAGIAKDWREGMGRARASITEGAALAVLKALTLDR
ncbi:MAG: anthranilate phosphoribosyltransferase [Acidobacteria bacterium]|nr:anthranilate phosphoribosyltransferase [Acidobacteriota bacterium]